MTVLASALVGRSDAPDVVQEASIVAFRKFGEFQKGSNFHAWAATIVRNIASNHQRSERRRRFRIKSSAWFAQGSSDHHQASIAGASNPIDADVLKLVEALDETARACLLLKIVRGHSYPEIAQILDIPEATARSHVFRARKELLGRLTTVEEPHHE